MLAFLKTIFGGRTASPHGAAGLAIPRRVYTPTARSAPTTRPAETPGPPAKTAPTPVPQTTPAEPSGDSNGTEVDIPLSSVLKGLPSDLKDRLRDLDIRGATLTISLERILAQLPSGSVRISFGSLRHAAPQLFSPGADCDGRDVALPLDEILSRINPAMVCRPQKDGARDLVEPESDGSSDSDAELPSSPPSRGSSLSVPPALAPGEAADATSILPSTAPARSDSAPAETRSAPIEAPIAQVSRPAPAATFINVDLAALAGAWPADLRNEIAQWKLSDAKVALPVAAVGEGLKRGRLAFSWQDLRSWITPSPPATTSVHDAANVELPLPVITPLFLAGQKQPLKSSKSAADDIPDLFFNGRPEAAVDANRADEMPGTSTEKFAAPEVPAITPPAASKAAPPAAPLAQPAPARPPSGVMRIPLKDLIGGWPEELRAHITHWDLPKLMVALPEESIHSALKQGKVVFSWETLRSWIVPAPPPGAFVNDKTPLELPLPAIMPLFLAGRKQPAKPQAQVPGDDIPDPFADFLPTPAARGNGSPVSVSEQKLSGTNNSRSEATPVAPETQLPVKTEPEQSSASPKHSSTPAEVLASATSLDGVAGALVALSDGFKVASKLPPGLDGDALAAFLPHIFSKVNQSARELRMGELNNLNFTVDNVPWKIFRVNQIFFAAFGRVGRPMPTAQLAALAQKLTFKN